MGILGWSRPIVPRKSCTSLEAIPQETGAYSRLPSYDYNDGDYDDDGDDDYYYWRNLRNDDDDLQHQQRRNNHESCTGAPRNSGAEWIQDALYTFCG